MVFSEDIFFPSALCVPKPVPTEYTTDDTLRVQKGVSSENARIRAVFELASICARQRKRLDAARLRWSTDRGSKMGFAGFWANNRNDARAESRDALF